MFTVELSHDNIPVSWFKNDQRLHTTKVVSMHDEGKTHSITFKDLSLDDTSQIKVEAMGISSEAKLTVLGRCFFQLNFIALNSAEICRYVLFKIIYNSLPTVIMHASSHCPEETITYVIRFISKIVFLKI